MKYNANNKPLVCMLTNSTCYKGTGKATPVGVLWHSTGANNTSISRYVQPYETDKNYDKLIVLLGKNKYKNDWNHIERNAGVNAWIGKLADGTVSTVQTMPWDYRSWGCGSGAKGSCNGTNGGKMWIQFEICEDSLSDKSYFEKVYKEACELTAYLCEMYNLNPKDTILYNGVEVPVILCHADSYKLGLGNNHVDVLHWFKKHGKTMDDVRNDVAKLIGLTAVVGTPSTGSEADAKKIWDYMMNIIGNPYGVAGLMGNLLAESAMRSNNMQDSYQNRLGYNDVTYTAAVDDGSYTNFVKDGVGYGLAQWTYYTRKQALLNYAKSKNKSIGDLTMQLEFLCKELNGGFKSVLNDLKGATSVLEASNSVLFKFEAPADQSEAMQKTRASYGQGYYDKYADKTVTNTPSVESKFKVGDEIKLVAGATYTTGKAIPSWVLNSTLYVRDIRSNGDIVFSTLKSGAITGTVNPKYITDNTQIVTKPSDSGTSASNNLSVGDEVNLITGAKYTSGKSIAPFVFNNKLYVRAINGNNVTISIFKTGAITGTVNAKYLTKNGQPVIESTTSKFNVGDAVKLISGATYASGKSIPSWVFKSVLYIRELRNDCAVVSTQKTGDVTGVVALKYLTKV